MFSSLAERHGANRLFRFAFGPEHMFWNQKNYRIFVVHGGPEQTGCIFGCARNDDGQTRVMSKHALVRLTMPQTSAGKISAIRRVNDGGTFPITERAPAQRREVCNQLIEAGVNEIDELQFEDRALAVGCETAGDPENGRFGERRIENLFRKFGGKLLR